ncbi:hypothetical protein MUK70_00435 [Dyadobacter chenwenxiniae]|uniref:DoxX-like family protein n=1 Tax=Dyadobacter chenwenxiniae TaxID=2906456 RepID=A0A9X1TMQ6_9BACT|nr:hypothetical protein [Dyadobacter chenwenxiniae]MCF0063793.1 hypothetical protein [Dyadobacter chenwenxiniae]UON83469.1 hypothetical protein MUK70_00435 [Dyadobacter chenwenxiniae]
MKIISIILILVSAALSIKHGWDGFRPPGPEQAKMMATLGITQNMMPYFSMFSIILGLTLFFPQTFFLSNVCSAITIVLIMALSLRAGDTKTALIEIPFLALPLILIWLKYPFKF